MSRIDSRGGRSLGVMMSLEEGGISMDRCGVSMERCGVSMDRCVVVSRDDIIIIIMDDDEEEVDVEDGCGG